MHSVKSSDEFIDLKNFSAKMIKLNSMNLLVKLISALIILAVTSSGEF